jgi:hypothetical protein
MSRLMTGLLTTSLCLASAPALAGGELGLHLSSQGVDDPDYAMFSDSPQLGVYGLRGAWYMQEHLGIVADVHRTRRGGDVYAYSVSSEEEQFAFRTGLTVHQLALGLKSRWELGRPSLAVYGLAQGLLVTSTTRFDDQPDEEDNPNELSYRGLAPGARAALGIEWLPLRIGFEDRLFTHLEAGYGWVAPLTYMDDSTDGAAQAIGDLRFRGVTVNWGVGWHF